MPRVRYASANHITYWIDTRRKLVLQWRAESDTETVDGLEVNPSLPDSDFQFTPPPGATERRPY